MQKCKTLFVEFLCGLLLISINQSKGQSEVGDGGIYHIRNVGNKKFLTADEEGIVGLRTGIVSTQPLSKIQSPAQAWILTWEPIAKEEHQGYWIQSKKDFLNAVTAYYIPGTSRAVVNIWKLKHLGNRKWEIENYRTEECLQVSKNKRDVEQAECNRNLESQQWNIIPIIKPFYEDDK